MLYLSAMALSTIGDLLQRFDLEPDNNILIIEVVHLRRWRGKMEATDTLDQLSDTFENAMSQLIEVSGLYGLLIVHGNTSDEVLRALLDERTRQLKRLRETTLRIAN